MGISRDLTYIFLWQFSMFWACSAAAKLPKGKAPRKPCNLQNLCHSPQPGQNQSPERHVPDPTAQAASKGCPALPRSAADAKPGQHPSRNPVSSAVNKLKCFKKYPKQEA